MKVSDLGEQALLELIREWTGGPSRGVLVGAGDDAAVLAASGEKEIVVSTDAYRLGVHFSADYFSPDHIGHRAMAGALSDLAAMGAEGVAAFVNLHVTPQTDIEYLRKIYQGMDRIADSCGVVIAGGDTVRGELALGITVIGLVPAGQAVLRSGAGEGDVICVTGELGKSEAGRAVLAGEFTGGMPAVMHDEAVAAHRTPRPRFDVSRLLMKLVRRTVDVELEHEEVSPVRPTAMIDVSDGLGIDLARLCEASGVGCRIEGERVPVSRAAKRVARAADCDPLELALGGGEDFELLFTMGPADVEVLFAEARKASLMITPIGVIVSRREGRVLMTESGVAMSWPQSGYDHFRR
jgi:thiamine-monophosphate kinase